MINMPDEGHTDRVRRQRYEYHGIQQRHKLMTAALHGIFSYLHRNVLKLFFKKENERWQMLWFP
jgi:hypothetical protein